MKAFFASIGEKISGLFSSAKDCFYNDKKKFFIIAGTISAAIILLIIVLCVLGGEKNIEADPSKDFPVVTDTAEVDADPTPIPTAQITAEITAVPTPSTELTPTVEPTATQIPSPTPNLHEGEVRSSLDGSWISPEVYNTRPYSIMFNNIKVARQQSGVGEAKILYEALVEDEITRLMGIYEGLTEESSCAERLGSVRSARHYYVSIAYEYDSIFIHWGGPSYAYDKLNELKIKDDLDGMYLDGSVFYRDKSIKKPHNGFTSLAGIQKYLAKKNIRTTHNEDYQPKHFTFNDEALYPIEGNISTSSANVDANASSNVSNETHAINASKVTLGYSAYCTPYLTYDVETKLYTRYQFGEVHTDYNTGLPLTFTNIIIQVVHQWDKDRNDYQDMEIEDASGYGYYISMGQCVPITWVKREADNFMMYYDSEGNELSINPGKTFISVYPDFREKFLKIEEISTEESN